MILGAPAPDLSDASRKDQPHEAGLFSLCRAGLIAELLLAISILLSLAIGRGILRGAFPAAFVVYRLDR